ncbi:hypothetical protein SAMN05192579_12150, partial [Rhodanobacter glycinis]
MLELSGGGAVRLERGEAVRLERVKRDFPSLSASMAMMVLRHNRHYEEEVSMSTITIGVDLAKSVF